MEDEHYLYLNGTKIPLVGVDVDYLWKAINEDDHDIKGLRYILSAGIHDHKRMVKEYEKRFGKPYPWGEKS
jgi:hypothetical protein